VEPRDGGQPEDDVRRADLRRGADPTEPHDEQHLREHKVPQAELLAKDGALVRDRLAGACELSRVLNRVVGHACSSGPSASVTKS
jgi:hypothetical protein